MAAGFEQAQAMVQEALAGRTPTGMGGQAAPAPAVSNPQGGFGGTPAAPVTPPITAPAPQPVAGMYPGSGSYGGVPVQRQAPAMMNVGTWGGQPMKAYNPNGPMVDSGMTFGGMPMKVPAAQLAGGRMWNDQGKDQARMDVFDANRQNNAMRPYTQPWDKDMAKASAGVANRQNNAQPGPFGKDSWRGQVARANGYQRY